MLASLLTSRYVFSAVTDSSSTSLTITSGSTPARCSVRSRAGDADARMNRTRAHRSSDFETTLFMISVVPP